MMNEQKVLNGPFDVEIHKKTFINYLEVIISEDGTIMYAVPSHQEKLISIACKKLKVSREELFNRCPAEYYFDLMNWLCQITNCISVWNEQMVGKANEKQRQSLQMLVDAKLYRGEIYSK